VLIDVSITSFALSSFSSSNSAVLELSIGGSGDRGGDGGGGGVA
jgi:hypothetical protein